jgi:membrane fusion protein (multidrug efflux system)
MKIMADEKINIEQEETSKRFKKRKVIIPLTIIISLVIGGLIYLDRASKYVSTDDAYIESHSVQVAPKVAGNVVKVYFDDNQQVKKGQLLAEIEPVDYEVKEDQLKASVEASISQKDAADKQILQAKQTLAQLNADINSAKAEFAFAQTELKRYTNLYKANTVSTQDLDKKKTAYQTALAKLDSCIKKAAAAQEQVCVYEAQSKTASAQIKQYKANLRQAELNVAYTKIFAPESGSVTKKAVEEGVYVQVGQPLFAIVPEKRWIVANFKETQLTKMQVGQPVLIKVDAYPNIDFHGKVDSIQQSTGSATSMFPPENAVGSFVKIVQRVPVKIVFIDKINSKYNIVPGMSVIPEVKVK